MELYFKALHCLTQWCLGLRLNDNAHADLLKGSGISSI